MGMGEHVGNSTCDRMIEDDGIEVVWHTSDGTPTGEPIFTEPYPNSAAMIADLRDNKRLARPSWPSTVNAPDSSSTRTREWVIPDVRPEPAVGALALHEPEPEVGGGVPWNLGHRGQRHETARGSDRRSACTATGLSSTKSGAMPRPIICPITRGGAPVHRDRARQLPARLRPGVHAARPRDAGAHRRGHARARLT